MSYATVGATRRPASSKASHPSSLSPCIHKQQGLEQGVKAARLDTMLNKHRVEQNQPLKSDFSEKRGNYEH